MNGVFLEFFQDPALQGAHKACKVELSDRHAVSSKLLRASSSLAGLPSLR